eukprot:1953_1
MSTKKSTNKKQRLSKSQSMKVACKHCYDSVEKRIYINTVSYLKNNHYPNQLAPRANDTRLSKLPHELINKRPSQWEPYVDYYPLNEDMEPIIDKPKSKTSKQTTLVTNMFWKAQISKTAAIPRPSAKARENISLAQKQSSDESKEQASEKPIEWYVQQALEKFKNKEYITARELFNYYETMKESDMSQDALFKAQNELLSALKTDFILSDMNALNVPEFLLKKRLKGLSIKEINDILFKFCSLCQTHVGGKLNGDWRTGIPITFDIYTIHYKDKDEFIKFKKSWNNHETGDLHKWNYSLLHSSNSDYKYSDTYKREIKILNELFKTVLEMKILRIANVNYPKILGRKYKSDIDIGNQPHSRFYLPDMISLMATHAKNGIKHDVNAVLPSTRRQPTVHATADKGEGLHKKIQLGHITYWSPESKDMTLKPIICNVLTYKGGEKSGSAKEVAKSLNHPFEDFEIKTQRVKSIVFDNQYFDNGTVREIEINWKKKDKYFFLEFRDTCHNINLMWGRVYGDCLFAQTVITNVKYIINPLNHGSIISLKAKDIMGNAAVSTPAFSLTKWIQKQKLSMSSVFWMIPALSKVYRNYTTGVEDMTKESDYLLLDIDAEKEKFLNKKRKKYVGQLEAIESATDVLGIALLCDIGTPYQTITTKNETYRHEPIEIVKEKNQMYERHTFEVAEIEKSINSNERCIIPESIAKFYPLCSAIEFQDDKFKLKLDMNLLNKRCSSLLNSKRQHKYSKDQWKIYIQKREHKRNSIVELFEQFRSEPNICVLPIAKFCQECDKGGFMDELINCYGCGTDQHLGCNDIQNRSTKFYSGNEIEFICKINGCIEGLKDVRDNREAEKLWQANEAPLCSQTINYSCKKIKQLNLTQLDEELTVHKVFVPRFSTLKAEKQKILKKHYQNKHFKQMFLTKPKKEKA